MIHIDLHSLRVWCRIVATSLAATAHNAWDDGTRPIRRHRTEEQARVAHPAGKRIPAPIEARPLTEAECVAAREKAHRDQHRAWHAEVYGYRLPPQQQEDLEVCEAIEKLGTKEHHA